MKNLNPEFVILDNENQILPFFNPSANKIEYIDTSLILYFFSQGPGTLFFQTNESFFYRLIDNQELQKSVIPIAKYFFEIDESFWINIKYVVRVVQHGDKELCELQNGELLPITKIYRKEIKNRLQIYLEK